MGFFKIKRGKKAKATRFANDTIAGLSPALSKIVAGKLGYAMAVALLSMFIDTEKFLDPLIFREMTVNFTQKFLYARSFP